MRAVQYAKTLAPTATVRAVYVETDPARTAKLEEKWAKWGLGVPLVVLTSPYRSLLRPFLDYIDQIQSRDGTPSSPTCHTSLSARPTSARPTPPGKVALLAGPRVSWRTPKGPGPSTSPVL